MGNNSKIVSAIDDEAMDDGDHPARRARGRRYLGLIRLGAKCAG